MEKKSFKCTAVLLTDSLLMIWKISLESFHTFQRKPHARGGEERESRHEGVIEEKGYGGTGEKCVKYKQKRPELIQ